MSETDKATQVTINYDGQDVSVPAGYNLVQAAQLLGKEIPHYCYHEKLSVSGNCRMCMVQIGTPMRDRATGEPVMDENGKQKIGWSPKPAIGCATTVSPGLHVRTDNDLVKGCRNGVTEFLLANHPLDCPICDKAGECRLQEYSSQYGRDYSRFVEHKVVKPKHVDIGPRIILDDERCILCSRCIRFCDEVIKESFLGFTERGSHATLSIHPGKPFDHNYSLNTVDICPVGALTSKDFRFQMRVWFLKPVNSICTESSAGVNTKVWSREGRVYRITPRRNDAVNDSWMSDSGRMLYKKCEGSGRLVEPQVGGHHMGSEETLSRIAVLLKNEKAAIVASAFSSVEEQFLLKRLAGAIHAGVHMISHTQKGDGLLISEDATPNLRGALLTGLISRIPSDNLRALGDKIDAGEVETLVCVREDLVQAGLSQAQLDKVNLVYLGTHTPSFAQSANVLMGVPTVFERAGSFVNCQWRIQKFAQAVPPPRGVLSELTILAKLLDLVGACPGVAATLSPAWQQLSKEVPAFAGLSYDSLPDEGALVDGGSLKSLPFVETAHLHYTPNAK